MLFRSGKNSSSKQATQSSGKSKASGGSTRKNSGKSTNAEKSTPIDPKNFLEALAKQVRDTNLPTPKTDEKVYCLIFASSYDLRNTDGKLVAAAAKKLGDNVGVEAIKLGQNTPLPTTFDNRIEKLKEKVRYIAIDVSGVDHMKVNMAVPDYNDATTTSKEGDGDDKMGGSLFETYQELKNKKLKELYKWTVDCQKTFPRVNSMTFLLDKSDEHGKRSVVWMCFRKKLEEKLKIQIFLFSRKPPDRRSVEPPKPQVQLRDDEDALSGCTRGVGKKLLDT